MRTRWFIVILIILVGIIVAAVIITLSIRSRPTVTDFKSCVAAGNVIMESYPEQCTHNGIMYVNLDQSVSREDEYIGLSEEAAFKAANAANTPARIVERDGIALPVTMDYVPGRLNFQIQQGIVTSAMVEG